MKLIWYIGLTILFGLSLFPLEVFFFGDCEKALARPQYRVFVKWFEGEKVAYLILQKRSEYWTQKRINHKNAFQISKREKYFLLISLKISSQNIRYDPFLTTCVAFTLLKHRINLFLLTRLTPAQSIYLQSHKPWNRSNPLGPLGTGF